MAFRRTRWVAAGGLVAVAATAVLPVPQLAAQTAAIEPGQGQAIAQAWKVDPKTGGLSFGFTFGQALAGHQNKVARAVSQAVNTGVIGSTMAGPGCDGGPPTWPKEDQPQALEVDSRDEGAAAGKEATDYNSPSFKKFARASDAPLAESVTTMGPFTVSSVLAVGGSVTRTTSGVIDGQRVAKAVVDIREINLATVVKLSDLHWEAVYSSSGVTGKFSIGHAVINGAAQSGPNPTTTLAAANEALKLFGFKLVEPKAYETGGVLFIDPLAIYVVPNAQRDQIAKEITAGTQEYRERLFAEMIARECDSADLISVFDIATGSMTGAGDFSLQLGGAQASSGIIPDSGFNLDPVALESFLQGFEPGGGTFAAPAADFGPAPTFAGGQATVSVPATPTRRTVTVPGNRPQRFNTQPAANTFEGKRGGAMAAVGLITLLLLAAVAEGDRRKMRHAQREIPVTEE